MKTCNKCKITKPKENFSWKKLNIRLSPICKDCHSKLRRAHYLLNKEKYINKARVRNSLIRDWYINYKSNLCCFICGEKESCCLEFHHLRDKKKDVSLLYTYSVKILKEEIEKCVVLCANCHRKYHAGVVKGYNL